ncbi:MAG: nuclear transport factor 2 family protein [Pseudomonadota bacterium]
MDAGRIVQGFWEVMRTNDFTEASQRLAPDFEYYMPQTREYLRGRAAFAGLNADYPTTGRWSFDIRSILADGDRAVSEVRVTDGAQSATAITFHTIRDGLIWRQVEYWPDPYERPAFRTGWTAVVDHPPF